MQSIELKQEKQDFRTKEAFKRSVRTSNSPERISKSSVLPAVHRTKARAAYPMNWQNPLHRMERKRSSLMQICVRAS